MIVDWITDLIDVLIGYLIAQMAIPVEYVVECLAEKLDNYGRSELVKDFTLLHGVLVRLSERNFGPFCQVSFHELLTSSQLLA